MSCIKHKTKFQKNVVRQEAKDLTQGGVRVKTSVVGLYKCQDCDFVRHGAPNHKAEWPQIKF